MPYQDFVRWPCPALGERRWGGVPEAGTRYSGPISRLMREQWDAMGPPVLRTRAGGPLRLRPQSHPAASSMLQHMPLGPAEQCCFQLEQENQNLVSHPTLCPTAPITSSR